MDAIISVSALMLSAGFVFWVAVMGFIIAGAEKTPWLEFAALVSFGLAAIAFAFIAGRVWP
jgi:hypothetical protein